MFDSHNLIRLLVEPNQRATPKTQLQSASHSLSLSLDPSVLRLMKYGGNPGILGRKTPKHSRLPNRPEIPLS
jgi:hypothetical protein